MVFTKPMILTTTRASKSFHFYSLRDITRFDKAEDPVEWELFRTAILEGQGWKLHRVWTPQFARDTAGSLRLITENVERFLNAEEQAAHPSS